MSEASGDSGEVETAAAQCGVSSGAEAGRAVMWRKRGGCVFSPSSLQLASVLYYPSRRDASWRASKVCVCSQLRPDVLLLSRRRDASCERRPCRRPLTGITVRLLQQYRCTAVCQGEPAN